MESQSWIRWLPGIVTLREYQRAWLVHDVVAGTVLATMLVPGIGLVIGGGLLAGILGGAALGAAGGTFLGPFVAMKMDESEARDYARAVEEGRTVVLVYTTDRADEAKSILERAGSKQVRSVAASPPGM